MMSEKHHAMSNIHVHMFYLTPSQRGDIEARVTFDLVTRQEAEAAASVVWQRVHSPAQAARHWRN